MLVMLLQHYYRDTHSINSKPNTKQIPAENKICTCTCITCKHHIVVIFEGENSKFCSFRATYKKAFSMKFVPTYDRLQHPESFIGKRVAS